MAQFRSTADIKTEVLTKAGEPINGNSDYDALAITYLNKAHQAIIGGGSIFSLIVDDAWVWARSRSPIILELLPPYTTGAVSCSNGDVNIAFTDAPLGSVEGYHFQIVGHHTVYKITQHDASESAAQIDSAFLLDDGTYSFRAFKLDYEIFPTYLYIDNSNDRLDFSEDSGVTKLTATLTHGSYTPDDYVAHVAARLNAVGTSGLYSGSYDDVLKYFTLTSSGAGSKLFSLLGPTGTNWRRSALPSLGFNMADSVGALTYSSTYIVNGISRMIEPFKLFVSRYCTDTQITGMDTDTMEKDYPLHRTCQQVPTRFAKIIEQPDGTVVVRFNSYPAISVKAQIDWIPVPHDLQNNQASIPEVPRKDVDTLIHAAATFILFDKNNTKWQDMLQLTGAGLQAMQKKNRSELFRTGKAFGQIIPRLDYVVERRRFNYGYTVDDAAPGQPSNTSQPAQMVTKSFTYQNFYAGVTQQSFLARILPANRSLFAVIVKPSVLFGGSGISAVTLDLGTDSNPTQFINGFDLTQTPGPDDLESAVVVFFPATATDINVRITAVGGNLNLLQQGALDIYFNESVVI